MQMMAQKQNNNAGNDDELLNVLKQFGEVHVLYDPSDPKDKNTSADEVINRFNKLINKNKNGNQPHGSKVQRSNRRSVQRTRKCTCL